MLIKGLIVIFCLFILYALGSGLYYLVWDRSRSNRVVKALTWRIGLSLFVFLILMIAYALGWITPHKI
jgi:hypothetical protein